MRLNLHSELSAHTFSDIPPDLSESLKINLFRIIQESLTNVLKYSSASTVSISMKKEMSQGVCNINLIIEDDGIGLDSGKTMTGLGLPGMKERVEMNQGTIEIKNKQDSGHSGLRIEVVVPIKTESE